MLSARKFSSIQRFTRIAVSVSILIFASVLLSFGGEILDDFDDGDIEGWERSPQNRDSKSFWGIEKGNTFVTFESEGSRVERGDLPAQFYRRRFGYW